MSQDKASFEQKLARLQEIVRRLEDQELPLEEGLDLFKEGSELVQNCRKRLEQARHKIQIYSQGMLQDFSFEAEANDQKRAQDEADA